MKKIAVGCLIVLAVAMLGFGVAGYYAYRWAQPMIRSTGDYLERAREMSRLGDRIANKSPYVPPANGELTEAQLDRFLAVQTRVRDEMGERWAEIDAKAAQIREKTQGNQRELTFTEFTSVLSDLAGIYMDARRAQVNALNVQRFSDAEYQWVRLRVYEAAGLDVASGIDMSKIEDLAREGAIPAANLKLVKPRLARIRETVSLAILGL